DYYRWHNTEHMPERVGVPGFLRGRRYLNTARPLDYFTLYETESVETIRSAPYLERLNDPTPWTRRLLPHFRDTMRVGCRVTASSGRGQGGALVTARLYPKGARAELLRAGRPGLALVRQLGGVIGVHVLEPAPETTRIQTKEKELRGPQPGEAAPHDPWILLVECNDAELADALVRGPLADDAGQPGTVMGTYRLQFSLDR
ncbi:MAG: hypothetical protein ACRELA_21060, partial [Candidatus Rokuibacteriota bacterium]